MARRRPAGRNRRRGRSLNVLTRWRPAVLCAALLPMLFLAAMSSLPAGDLAAFASQRHQLQEAPRAPANLRGVSGVGRDDAWIVGDGGYAFHTTDGGATWIPQDSGTGEDLLAVSAVDESTAWAAGRRGTVLLTRDGGDSWQALDTGLGRDIYSISALDPDRFPTVAGGTDGASCAWAVAEGPVVLYTTDGGATWEHLDPGSQSRLTAITALGPGAALAAGENGTVLLGGEGGRTWTAQAANTADHLVGLSVTGLPAGGAEAEPAGGGDMLFNAWALGETGTVITTTDGGATWTAHNFDAGTTLSAVCAVDARIAWLAGRGGMLRKTADGGATWTAQDAGTSNTVLSLYAGDADVAWAVGENGTVIRTCDGGATWISQYVSDGRSLSDACAPPGAAGTAWAVGEAGAALLTIDGGFTWNPVYSGTARNLNGVAAADAGNAWLVGQDGLVLRTRDGGRSWEEQPSRASHDLNDVSCAGADVAWAVGRRGTIIRTFDGGYTWYRQDPKSALPGNAGGESAAGIPDLLGVYAADASTAWAVGRGGVIIKTIDEGETWSVQESGTSSDLFSVHGSGADDVWACGGDGTVLHTADGGRTWFPVDAGTDADLFAVSATPGAAWVAGRDGFVARSGDGGETWSAMHTGTTAALRGMTAPDADTAWAVGARGTIIHYRSSPRLDAVSPAAARSGDTVTLSGMAFGEGGPGSFVSFGSVKAREYSQWSDRLIKVTIPAETSTREEVTVTTPRGTAAARTLIILPRVHGASPRYCRAGRPLTVSGASFGHERGDSFVTVGGVKITEFEYWTNNLVRFNVPGNAPASAEVKVVTASGASNPVTVSVSRTPPPLPDLIRPRLDFLDPVSVRTGDELRIYGSGFGPGRGSSYVSFGAERANEYTSWANDLITVRVPPGVSGKVKVTVTTPAGTSGALAVTVLVPPAITGITPASGPAGSKVEISGTAFGPREGPANYVSFNGVSPQAYDYWSDGRIVAGVPAQLDGVVEVTVTTPVGTSAPLSFYVKKPDLRAVDAVGGAVWAAGENGTVLKSADGGATWNSMVTGTSLWLYGVSAGSASVVWAVGEGGVILRTADGGTTWDRHPAGSTSTLYAVDAAGASVAWAVGEGGVILKTADGGATWDGQPSGVGVALRAVCAVDANVAWAVGDGGTVLTTADGGASWTPCNSRVAAGLYGVSAVSAEVCWAVGSGGTIIRTADGGLTWTPQGRTVVGEAGMAGQAGGVGAAGAGVETDEGALADAGGEGGEPPGGGKVDGEAGAGSGSAAGAGDAAQAPGLIAGEAAPAPEATAATSATLRAVCALDPLTAWAVGDGGAAFKTIDGGLTWVPCGTASGSLYGITSLGTSALAVGAVRNVRLLP